MASEELEPAPVADPLFVVTRARRPSRAGEITTEYLTPTGSWVGDVRAAQVFSTAGEASEASDPHRFWYAVRRVD